MVSVWRQGRNEQYLRAVIKVAPSHVSYVAHDGSRYTLPFYPKVTIESNAEGSDLVVRSQRRDGVLFISRHLIGFKRLRSLLYAYSSSTAPSDARPGKDEF